MVSTTTTPRPESTPATLRDRALAGIPATGRRLELAGVDTALLEAGDGPGIVALHGPGANASHWGRVIADLAEGHHVIVPDLPGQGASVVDGDLDADRVIGWLSELVEATCQGPPALVGNALGGAIAARFAIEQPQRCQRLVLVDALGLRAFQPSPRFGQALNEFVVDPNRATHDGLWAYCAHDLPSLRERMGATWEALAAYNVDRAQEPRVQEALGALMGEFGLPAIPPADLDRIKAPTHLIWGRHDEATPLAVAEEAAQRRGWTLEVIEDCADDPPVEQPEAFARALRAAIAAERAR